MNPELPTVLSMAPTGVAAIKIDEISMVANNTLLHIHQRLKEIVGTSNVHLFAGISILAIGDMYQLPPIRRKPVFANYKNDVFNLCHPWHLFTMIELVDIMRQKDDQPFAELLNRFRTATQTEEDIKCIQSRSIDPSDVNYPSDALHIWAENNPVNRHNEMKLHQIPAQLFNLEATDQYPPNVSQQDINRILARVRPRSETGGVDANICIKESVRVMLTNNIDIADTLINGQIGTVVKIEVNQNNKKPSIIYVKFDDTKAGNNLIQKSTGSFVRQNRVVPIEPVLAKFKVHPNKPSSPEIQRMQFPLTLAYAVSIHIVQGLSLNSLVINFELVKKRSFNYGQVYVALSRATSVNGIHILGKINSKHVKADPRVHKEYERLREISKTRGTSEKYKDNSMLTIYLLNIRSLKKHSVMHT
ncbi:ATP-dependent DNA helicase PIF1-like [Montipora capricornis]|uniref:ATP-dependent DNA helicase PIF1-like n=1 Tax=Montipora capricornis TaxID=246305 RepID=UPI0035F1F0C5